MKKFKVGDHVKNEKRKGVHEAIVVPKSSYGLIVAEESIVVEINGVLWVWLESETFLDKYWYRERKLDKLI